MSTKQNKQNILVVAAHADDEVLGCGGTLAKHIHQGDVVKVIFMTNGVSSRLGSSSSDKSNREIAMIQALKVLGIEDYQCFDFPDNQMDSVPLLNIVQTIEQVISSFAPDTIYSHYSHDLNVDHQITHQAVMTACRPIKGSSVKKILSFEVLSSTEWQTPNHANFRPQYIVDISQYWSVKEQALVCYQEELRESPHSRSLNCISALATLRGETHGMVKAEAFQVERILN